MNADAAAADDDDEWADEQIEAARGCLRAATMCPQIYKSEKDISEDQHLPPETDPIKLRVQHLRRSREELTSEHIRAIAALPTQKDRDLVQLGQLMAKHVEAAEGGQ
ncbi:MULTISPECIES: hypothetical protein [Mycobacteroides]|uniref:hypothetical protein n=1 Tax=Mycobacteroides TaxID=670516 RepID=UPI000A40E1C7|nr:MULTISPECIES: hypothetical protein [Mycobacteroides]MDB2197356.1 hypothetical protein [Mycobacteroides abscessus subsp. abscessus]MDB2202059.1 hypothetical protein [Mycobacteroides abscessus subsp. abscessus]